MNPSRWHQTGEGLAGLLSKENAALTALDLQGAVAMLETKAILIARFEALKPDQSQHQAAVELLARLALLAAENRRLLDRAIKAQKRVIGVIAGVVRQTPLAPRYGNQGALRSTRAPLTLTLSSEA